MQILSRDTDRVGKWSVSRRVSGPKTRFPCRDTDRCAASYVSRRVSVPKTRFLSRGTDGGAATYVSRRASRPKMRFSCRDTDRMGKWPVSWQAGIRRLLFAATPFGRAFVDCLSLRRLSPKCARRTGHRQRGIRFLLRALALERPVCAAILRYTASGRSFVRALWRETQINGQNGGKHRSAEKSGDGYGRADYCFDTTTM